GVVVVIDVLRASTTIAQALASGALAVVPCQSVPEAHAVAAELAGIKLASSEEIVAADLRAKAGLILGGERQGALIPGFDLDNSPLKYAPDTVNGKTVIFTTTNGTRALQHCRLADRVLLGGFNNLHAVIALLAEETRPIHLVCAGTDGAISTDDALCAGAIATGVWAARKWPTWSGDSLRLVMDLFTCRCQPMRGLVGVLRDSLGGRNLIELGFEADIDRAARWDLFRVVPEFDPATRRILPAADVPAEPKPMLMAPRE
ncbi:MAG TPA: 2-phosphosulfolactate phosphatase, partial [Planctomycetaceae bacterium]|nr:2-phosphosulfolactate phosphatase [Planctomycetaceae bacterium]